MTASQLSQEGDFVGLAAKIGLVCLNLVEYSEQLLAGKDKKGKKRAMHIEEDLVDLRELLKECRAWGGTLDAVAHVLEACFSSEILKAKYVFSFILHQPQGIRLLTTTFLDNT